MGRRGVHGVVNGWATGGRCFDSLIILAILLLLLLFFITFGGGAALRHPFRLFCHLSLLVCVWPLLATFYCSCALHEESYLPASHDVPACLPVCD